MNSLILIAVLGIAVWFWQDSLRARELAVNQSRKYCNNYNYQFLDESVALISLRPVRNSHGTMAFYRKYHFEFSLDGYNRYNGTANIIGHQLQSIQLDHPQGQIIENSKDIDP